MSNQLNHIGYVGLGSNLGDGRAHLHRAVTALGDRGLSVQAVSDIYMTEPQGLRDQNWFSNMVVQIRVHNEFKPEAILDVLLEIEQKMGRVRTQTWGPRIIDLDLLLLGETSYRSSRLILPHPRLHQRAFVLVPLCQLDPDLIIKGVRASDWLASLPYRVDNDRIWQT